MPLSAQHSSTPTRRDPSLLSRRAMGKRDMPFLEALYASTREEELQVTGWSAAEIQHFLAFQFKAQHKHYQDHYADASFDVVLYDGKPAGRLYLQERDREFRIVDIALMPAFRGGGLGRFLLEQIQQDARAKGKCVCIHVENNNRAMNLYKRLGFVRIGETGVYHLMEWRPFSPQAADPT